MTEIDATYNAAIIATLLVLLAAAVVTDLSSHRIPNILLAPALSLALVIQTIHGGADGLVIAGAGLVLGIAIFLPLYLVGGVAAGDVKLLGVVGSFLGPSGAVIAGLATMMVGAVFGIAVIAWRIIRPELEFRAMQTPGPPDGSTHVSADLTLSRSQERFTYIAYAPAIAAGTVAALWYIGYLPERLLG